MTNANSPSEDLWQVLHQARALLTDGGFAEACPPLPAPRPAQGRPSSPGAAPGPSAPTEGYGDLVLRYSEHLPFGTPWPAGEGSPVPRALILTAAPLSPGALAFVRSWFENPRVGLTVAGDFYVQALPPLTGEHPPFKALGADLARLFQPKAIFSLGPVPAQRLLGAPLSLDSLRGSDYRFDRWSVVTTLDPEGFLDLAEGDRPAFKAQVWKDLQRLLGKIKYG